MGARGDDRNVADYHDLMIEWMRRRGIDVIDIAAIVYEIQHRYIRGLTLDACIESVHAVINKREVQHLMMTGIALDIAAEQGALPEPLLSILRRDEPLYGVDETLALGITNVYGSIGITNFGYLDKLKEGAIGRLNRHDGDRVHTFLDDIVAGIAAAASARIAHNAVEGELDRENRPFD